MLQCTDIKKQPTANIIDGNVQLHILSLIPDNFQGVTEMGKFKKNVTVQFFYPHALNMIYFYLNLSLKGVF